MSLNSRLHITLRDKYRQIVHFHIFNAKAIASSLALKVRTMLERGSAVDAQPIKGFSHLSLVSNSIFHFFVLFTPDCMLLRAGTKILTFLVLMCSSGTPVIVVISCGQTRKQTSLNTYISTMRFSHFLSPYTCFLICL